jgi:2-polyprenyl-3-methyl-5-hydroxy-6-metoxy-1,4-benzoquinol methylase
LGGKRLGDKAKPWHEDDNFWETWRSLMFSPQHMANAPSEVEKIMRLLNLPPGAHILDLGCGIGQHSLEMARRGFKVTGVDRTLSYIKKAGKTST